MNGMKAVNVSCLPSCPQRVYEPLFPLLVVPLPLPATPSRDKGKLEADRGSGGGHGASKGEPAGLKTKCGEREGEQHVLGSEALRKRDKALPSDERRVH